MCFRPALLALLCTLGVPGQSYALPHRLVLCLDGVSWRDVKALQEGVARHEHGPHRGTQAFAFNNGYYPVSKLVSTFPSCSDVAWTELLGNDPLPGYQRSYFDASANKVVVQNGITTTMEYEKQMHWQIQGGWRRALGYFAPVREFKHEVRLLINDFLTRSDGIDTFYAMLRTTDDAQHMSGDILTMLQLLDARLAELQLTYRAKTGRDLEILVLSDHGNNHAGPGKRVAVVSFLKHAGYRIATSIHGSRDVVLPTAGIESWIEIHNAPGETSNLVSKLVQLKGVDLITARLSGSNATFLVSDRNGARALITHNPALDRYRYRLLSGDPLEYRPVLESLRRSCALDENDFASAEAWTQATLSARYPVALERITRGLTSVTGNPATILVSLDNRYVHANPFVFFGSRLVTCSGTHGGLDSLNSDGILLSNFRLTSDTTTAKLARDKGAFSGRNHCDDPVPELRLTSNHPAGN